MVLGALCALCLCAGAWADDLLCSRDELVTVNGELAWEDGVVADSFAREELFESSWLYVSLPGFSVGGKNVFTALEADILHRSMYLSGEQIAGPALQRYGFFGGITLIDRGTHRGSFLVGAGVAGDLAHFEGHMWYAQAIYDHRFVISDKLELGLGVLFSYNLGEIWTPPINLLPSLSWRITPKTILKAAWDNLVLEQYVFARTSVFAEIRYDLSYFGLQNNVRYSYQTVAAAAGVNVRVAGNVFVRARYKEQVFRDEELWKGERWSVGSTDSRGRSVSLSVVYAK